ncbi:MAG: hypothetical protein HY300_12380 [Verrucomicrobia bacterium]|nr:hypothetical protein [Verrucomicrobiota bacterium]
MPVELGDARRVVVDGRGIVRRRRERVAARRGERVLVGDANAERERRRRRGEQKRQKSDGGFDRRDFVHSKN